MKWIREKIIYIVLIYINFNFILKLLEKSMFIGNFDYGFTSLLMLLGFLIYWFYDYVLRKDMYRVLFTLSIFIIGAAYYVKKAKFVNDIVNQYFLKNIIILNDLIYKGAITYFYQYKIVLIIGIPLLISLILWITFTFIKQFILIVSLGAVITIWFSNSYLTVVEYLFVYLFISSLTFIIMSYLKRIQKYKREGVKVSLKFGYILIYGVIISLLIAKITVMLPQNYKGRDLSDFGNYFENRFASDNFDALAANKSKYNLASSGYSGNDKRLGGPISLDFKEAFKVESDKPYYLKGNVSDFYDGNKWTKADENYLKMQIGVDLSYVKFGDSKISDIKKSLTIYPNNKFKTNTIFLPNYAFKVNDVQGTLFYDKAPMILSKKVILKPYSVDFYQYGEVIDTIEDVRNFSEKTFKNPSNLQISVVRSFVPNGPMDYFLKPKNIETLTNKNTPIFEKFSRDEVRDNKILLGYSKYLQVPENISKRTYDLVQDITKNSKTSIDKVLQIKNYLTKNYVYDLKVSVVPQGSEFIDYFLFVEKKGYCTYFNTAMTMMCRMAGVPARYVEGFKTPNKKDDSRLYSVSNSDAHAWCEVLLGAFEYSNMWTVVDASPTASEDLQKKTKELQAITKDSGDNSSTDINKIPKSQNERDNIDLINGQSASKLSSLSDVQLKWISILTVVLLFILMRFVQQLIKRDKLLKSNGVAPLYNYYIHRLAAIWVVKPEFQGDLEFAESIKDIKLKERMKILVKGSYEEFYGKHTVVQLNNREYYDFLEGYLKNYEGMVQYILNKYLGIG